MKLVLAITALLVGISIACSASRSAEPHAVATSSPVASQTFTATNSAATQEKQPCTLNITQAPVIKGLRLGMTADEVLALFPGSKEDAEVQSQMARPATKLGATELAIQPDKYEAADFKDVSRIAFSLLDGRVADLSLHYKGPEWSHVDQFVEKLARELNLPPAAQWESYAGLDNQMKTLTCVDFSIRANAAGAGGNLNFVLLSDLEAEKKIKERRRKAREQASPTPGQ
jgi:hypothetical protein